ncbi:hypothetical protein EMCRGX_G008585 [Ephydatia muelleri]
MTGRWNKNRQPDPIVADHNLMKAGHKVESIGHINLENFKVLFRTMILKATSEVVDNSFNTLRAGYSQLQSGAMEVVQEGEKCESGAWTVGRSGAWIVVLWISGATDQWCHGSVVPWISGAMDQWCYGSVVPWISGAMDQWCHGSVVPRISGAMDQWCHGSVVPRISGAMDQWCHGSVVPRISGAMDQWCHGSVVPWISGATDQWCHGSVVPWISGAMDQWCHGSVVPWISGAMDQWCHGSVVPWISGAMDQWCHGSVVPWISGVMDQWCHGSVVPRISGAMDQWCHGSVVPRISGAMDQWCHGSVVPRISGAMDNIYISGTPWVHGPALGLYVNLSKCEVFTCHNLDVFPSGMNAYDKPNIEILGAAIGDLDFCSSFISTKLMEVRVLLSQLECDGPPEKAVFQVDDYLFNHLLNLFTLADKARLLSISSHHASVWMSVTLSASLGLHLNPPVFQVAVKWWLGLDISEGSQCALCPGNALDHLGHHAVTCKYGGDVVSCYNGIRDILVETCRRARIGVQVEVSNNLTLTQLTSCYLTGSWAKQQHLMSQSPHR